MTKNVRCGCFYVDGNIKVVQFCPETEELVYRIAWKQNKMMAAILFEAYCWAREGGVRELTEALILQYLKTLKK
jgi:hypothetical protein